MNLWKRIKNVFTDELVDSEIVADKDIELKIVRAELEETLILLKSKERLHAYGRPFHIEWDFMGIPFSVERQLDPDGDFLMTVIGYYPLINPTNKAKEWRLPLNDDQHATLVEDFKKWAADWSADSLVEKLKFSQDKTND